jgi:hypothetical protein
MAYVSAVHAMLCCRDRSVHDEFEVCSSPTGPLVLARPSVVLRAIESSAHLRMDFVSAGL